VAGTVPATVTGDALKLVPVNRQAFINIELPNAADLNDVTVTVTGVCKKVILKFKFRFRDGSVNNSVQATLKLRSYKNFPVIQITSKTDVELSVTIKSSSYLNLLILTILQDNSECSFTVHRH
jgi:hypothetical protein